MRSVVSVWTALAALLVLGVAGPSLAASPDLAAAVAMFERQEYEAAQAALAKVDRSKLTDAEKTKASELVAVLPRAIDGQRKAGQSLQQGDADFDAGEYAAADRAYIDVQTNAFASASQRAKASSQRARILEQSGGSGDAVRPMTPVDAGPGPAARPAPGAAASPSVGVSGPPTGPALAPMPRVEQPRTPDPGSVGELPRRLTPTEQMRVRDDLLWQRATAQAEALAEQARTALADGDFDEARRLAEASMQTIEAARRYAEPVEKYEIAIGQAKRLKEEVESASSAEEDAAAAREREAIKARLVERKAQIEAEKAERIEQLFSAAEQLRRERRFAESAETLRQILLIDPGNAKARYQLEVAEDYESFGEQSERYRDMRVEGRRALHNAESALIPWDYDVLYPRNWMELTARRVRSGILESGTVEDSAQARLLDESIPEVRFDQTPFEQVLAFLGESTGANLSIDWDDLDTALVTSAREKPVTVSLSNLKFRSVLNEVLSQAGGETPLSYSVSDGMLRIASKDKLDRNKFVSVYDVRDLLGEIPQAPLPDFDKPLVSVDGGGASRSLFTTSNSSRGGKDETDQHRLGANKMDQLKSIIQATVEPDLWAANGGGAGGGTLQDLNGQLIVYGTSTAQRGIVNLLGELRETQALQISVESRFLDVVSNFLEQFGIDLDFVFNSGSAGFDRAPDLVDPFTGAPVLIPRQFSRIGALPTTPPFGTSLNQVTPPIQPYGQPGLVPQAGGIIPQIEEMTPIAVGQNSLSLVDPTAINTGVPGTWSQRSGLAPALNIAGSFLDNLQVDFLIRATQANSRSSIVQAPRQVMLNGQAVVISIENFRRYISSLEPVVGDNVGLPRPIPADAVSGLQVWVQGVVSEDRRYTTLSIAFQQQGEPSFERFELQRASGNSPSIFLLLPAQSRVQYSATVSIPDGGTVLLGGFKQVGEVEVEAGVPILSKIPVLKRAFTNTTTVKDTRTLLLLVKSKIIIQKEAEDEAFPTFSGLEG